MSRVRVLFVAGCAVVCSTMGVVGSAVAGPGGIEYTISNPPMAPATVRGEPTTVYQGELLGSGYIVEVPPDWNHELVMWAHGYRGEGTVLTVDQPGYGLRQHLLDLGYAWAASSYNANGYDIESGVRSTRRLASWFRRVVDRPDRVYIGGVSMGGHITARSIEEYPDFYAGALPMCGVLGDVELYDYFIDFTFVGQALAKEALDAAGVDAYPIRADYQDKVVPVLQEALGTAGIGFGPPTNELGLQFRSIVVEQSGGPRPGGEVAFSVWKDFLFRLAGPDDGGMLSMNPQRVGTNVDTDYTPDTPVAVDDEVLRIAPVDARARNSGRLGPIARIEGVPDVPVLSLHDLGDLFVPFSMEQYYAADVAANGRSELLVQRAIRAMGHCEFSSNEVLGAFDDLVTWVEDGVRPEGDDVSDPAIVADPNFGCAFSDRVGPFPPSNSRPLFPACPPL